ncbi:MAG: hypothetical protein COB49_12280, partial [Alphaproteobacteria bacterium]
MINKFVGRGGSQNRVAVLLENPAVGHNQDIAQYVSDKSNIIDYKKADQLTKGLNEFCLVLFGQKVINTLNCRRNYLQ